MIIPEEDVFFLKECVERIIGLEKIFLGDAICSFNPERVSIHKTKIAALGRVLENLYKK